MITGRFIGGDVSFPANGGNASMVAKIDLIDDALGQVGSKLIPVDDPAVIQQVQAFVEQMMPMLSAQAGFTITLPEASE